MKLSPQLYESLKKFTTIRRGYWSFILLMLMVVASIFAELWISNRPVIVNYQGKIFFPTYGDIVPGTAFGLDYDYETNYRELKQKLSDGKDGWMLSALVPYSPYETIERGGDEYPPYAPSFEYKNYLGTDAAGRDVLARLVYGFRVAILFSLALLICTYAIGVSLGCLMGYFGGWFDILFQRFIEVWSMVPFLYVIIIISSIIVPNFKMLLLLMVVFGWQSMTYYMRSKTYKEKSRLYVLAARSLGASPSRIIFRHILPNSWSIILTFMPFSIAGGITSLTALDYLGFGLPAPTPSWGELLEQGTTNMDAMWIAGSVVMMMVVVLTMVTFIGEAVREAFDPKQFSYYE